MIKEVIALFHMDYLYIYKIDFIMIEPPKNSINNQITTASNKINRLENGINIIKGYLSKLNISSGVYRMINCNGEVLYIGKAYNLKKRVASYTRPMRMPIRLQRMVAETVSMDSSQPTQRSKHIT